MSIFVLNIATMLGLALAIDYSLFIVSRFREELRRGRTVAEAVERAVATAGKAVAFSGIAVAIGLSGLLLFEAPAIRSIGIAGALVVALLGRLRADLPAGRARACSAIASTRCRWAACATGSGRSPTVSSRRGARAGNASRTPSCAGRSRCSSRPSPSCSSLGSPFLRLEQGVPGAEIYPPGVESRDAYVALQTEFAPGETTPIIILADVQGSPTDLANIQALDRLRGAGRRARGDRPGREPVRHPRPGDRRAPAARTGRGAVRAPGRPASAGHRRAARALRSRVHRPPRCHQPAPAIAGPKRPT